VWLIGRDSKYWTESEEFIPERSIDSSVHYKGVDFQFLLFGAGRRM
jgi:cytochrome P450